jgi:hypothetical protein
MEHQPGRGAYQSREDNQASNVWAGKLRPAPATGSCRCIIEPAAGRYRQKIRSTATVDSHVFRVHRKCGRTRNARTLSPIYADLLAQGDWLRLAPRLALIDQRPQHRPLLVIQDNKSALLHHSSDRLSAACGHNQRRHRSRRRQIDFKEMAAPTSEEVNHRTRARSTWPLSVICTGMR